VHEKLTTVHGFNISVETLRSWMTANDLWIPRSKRLKHPYQPRYNRHCFGELIQIDGSCHDWFEGRAAKCCLLVYIDDATPNTLLAWVFDIHAYNCYINISLFCIYRCSITSSIINLTDRQIETV